MPLAGCGPLSSWEDGTDRPPLTFHPPSGPAHRRRGRGDAYYAIVRARARWLLRAMRVHRCMGH
eukprot:9793982-Alexandrium_andersonii.AAC.1